MRLGDIDITPLSDGMFTAPPEYFGPNVSFEGHEDILDPDGKLRLPIGAFLVRGIRDGEDRTVLIDAGLGHLENEWFYGGKLLDELTAAGASPGDVDTIVCSHLHVDHCGWLIDETTRDPVFPNATLWAGSADWRLFVEERGQLMLDHIHEGLGQLAEAGRVTLMDGDTSILPGLSTMAAPGHTPGHMAVVLSAGEQRALLLGDAISCPVQLDETDWAAMSDVDPELARKTRERMWNELEGGNVIGVGAHFPGLQFGRVLTGEGRRWWS
jgi:glyoxylase-like metal-dependent hydrolase (beta-lactamase superfamily II)